MISIFSDLLRCVMVIYPTGALVLFECQSLSVRTFCDIVKLRSRFRFRSRSGEGQEAKSRAKSSSEDSKLNDLDLSCSQNNSKVLSSLNELDTNESSPCQVSCSVTGLWRQGRGSASD